MDILSLCTLFLMAIGYGVFPLLFPRFRKKPIKKRTYSILCFAVNLVVWLFVDYIALQTTGDPASAASFLFWTWIFSRIGAGSLDKRGVLNAQKDIAADSPSC